MFNSFTMNSVLGKLTLLVLVVLAAHYHLLAAILIVFLFIAFSENVIEGMDIVKQIESTKTDSNDKPETPVQVKKITIQE